MISKNLSIGTANFGMRYGYKKLRSISVKKIREILKYARKVNISSIDTAYNYGYAEEKLGEIGVKDWNISSKFPSTSSNSLIDIDNHITKKLTESLIRLRVNKIENFFIHNRQELKNFDKIKKIFAVMENLKKRGLIKNIGCIVYDPEILKNISKDFPINVIQAPANILDQRIFNSDNQRILKINKIKLELRSIFLQGLLFEKKKYFSQKLKKYYYIFENINKFFEKNKINRINGLINFLKGKKFNRVIVGLRDVKELEEIIKNIKYKNFKTPNFKMNTKKTLINPYLW